MRIALVSPDGAIAQPTRQPVTAYVFDSALIVTVRSSSPGTVAGGTGAVDGRGRGMGRAFPVRGVSRIYPGEYGADVEIEIRQVFEPEPHVSN